MSSHTAFKELPIVNISKLFSSNLEDRKEVAKELGKAAREVGFLYITGHGIDKEKIDKINRYYKKIFCTGL